METSVIQILYLCIIVSYTECAQRFLKEPSDMTVKYGEPVILPCLVTEKKGVLQWTKDGFGLGTDRNLVGFDRYHMIGTDEAGKIFTTFYHILSLNNRIYFSYIYITCLLNLL